MFSTLLSTIQTAFSTLVSKSFLISSMFPVFVFLAAMAAMAKALQVDFVLALFRKDGTAFQNTLAYSLISVGVLALAYVMSSLATAMLETLDGRHLTGGMRAWFHTGQHRRLAQLNSEIGEARDEAYNLKFDNELQSRGFDRSKLEAVSAARPKIQHCDYPVNRAAGNPRDLIDGLERTRKDKAILRRGDLEASVAAILPYLARCDENENSDAGRALKSDRERLTRVSLPWLEQLKWTSEQEPKTTPCVYPPQPPAQNPHTMIEQLEKLQERGEPIARQYLQNTVNALLPYLRQYDEDEGTPSAEELGRDRRRLFGLINYARDRRKSDFLRLSNQKQFNYPGEVRPSFGRSSINVLAPTRFGNIGRTMRSYALTRYSLDLDLFWTRLQRTMQSSTDKFYQVLQETKAQVDCFVALTFLSAIFTIFWIVYLMARFEFPFAFLATGVAGPLAIYVNYRLACQSYSVFADLVRSAVDMYRFGLLTDLHIAQPAGSREEEILWERLGDRTGYDSKETVLYTTNK